MIAGLIELLSTTGFGSCLVLAVAVAIPWALLLGGREK